MKRSKFWEEQIGMPFGKPILGRRLASSAGNMDTSGGWLISMGLSLVHLLSGLS